MAEPSRAGRVITKTIPIALVAAAAAVLVCLWLRGAAAGRPDGLTGDNPAYPVPRAGVAVPAVTSAALVENANAWDGRTVRYSGEAVGELMARGDMAWLHLNDDPYQAETASAGGPLAGYNSGHAVWAPAALARRVAVFGDYNHGGDVVMVTGVFHAACREHGGDMDIHAESLVVVKPGRAIAHRFNAVNALVALGLCLAAAVLYILKRVTARK